MLGQIVTGSHNPQRYIISFLKQILGLFFIIQAYHFGCDVVKTNDNQLS